MRDLRRVETANESRHDVAVQFSEVVVLTIQVGGHGADEAGAELPVVTLAGDDAGDLRNRVRRIRWLERPIEQRVFRNRLGRSAWIDAGAAEKEQLFHAKLTRSIEH